MPKGGRLKYRSPGPEVAPYHELCPRAGACSNDRQEEEEEEEGYEEEEEEEARSSRDSTVYVLSANKKMRIQVYF